MKWIKTQISIGNIAVIVFLLGGFYYTTNYKFSSLEDQIQQTKNTFDSHMEYQFRPLRDDVESNSSQVQKNQSNYQALESLIKEQEKNQTERYNRIEARLDRIIQRMGNE